MCAAAITLTGTPSPWQVRQAHAADPARRGSAAICAWPGLGLGRVAGLEPALPEAEYLAAVAAARVAAPRPDVAALQGGLEAVATGWSNGEAQTAENLCVG